ncbi:hypothetical protein [Schaalia suimastitidis]|uniref:hypothetical protein n=1 Tax=Schaalia suimastitidis TaxID=121163 RepID=UPI000412B308|nr:hypothetical protein [Schaalia suimastitidis]
MALFPFTWANAETNVHLRHVTAKTKGRLVYRMDKRGGPTVTLATSVSWIPTGHLK